MSLTISRTDTPLSICRLDPAETIPQWALRSSFYSCSGTPDELSIVCETRFVPEHIQKDSGYGLLKVHGPLDFSLTGILSRLLAPLAQAGIPVFTISTYDTDYILIKLDHLDRACTILSRDHVIIPE